MDVSSQQCVRSVGFQRGAYTFKHDGHLYGFPATTIGQVCFRSRGWMSMELASRRVRQMDVAERGATDTRGFVAAALLPPDSPQGRLGLVSSDGLLSTSTEKRGIRIGRSVHAPAETRGVQDPRPDLIRQQSLGPSPHCQGFSSAICLALCCFVRCICQSGRGRNEQYGGARLRGRKASNRTIFPDLFGMGPLGGGAG